MSPVTPRRGRIIVALSVEEASYLRHLLTASATAADVGGALQCVDSVDERRAGAALMRRVAERIEQTLSCPECGQVDAHAARCSLRHPNRD